MAAVTADGPGIDLDRRPGRPRRRDQARTRVGDAGHAGIGRQGQRRSRAEAREELGSRASASGR